MEGTGRSCRASWAKGGRTCALTPKGGGSSGDCSQAPSWGCCREDRPEVREWEPEDQGGLHRSRWETMGLHQVEAEGWEKGTDAGQVLRAEDLLMHWLSRKKG